MTSKLLAGLVLAMVVGFASACGGGGKETPATAVPTKAATAAAPTSAATQGATTAATGGGDAAAGEKLYGQYCAACHGANAAGGYKLGEDASANLRWVKLGEMYNGDTGLVARAILEGKDEDGKTLNEVMPRWKDTLTQQQVNDLIAFFRTLTTAAPENQPPAAPAGAGPGEQIFYQYCALCHGANGAGDKDIGTSKSADLRWAELGPEYKNDVTLVSRAILEGKNEDGDALDPEMPRWAGVLTPDQVQQVVSFLQTLK